jgi:hypothetical protein
MGTSSSLPPSRQIRKYTASTGRSPFTAMDKDTGVLQETAPKGLRYCARREWCISQSSAKRATAFQRKVLALDNYRTLQNAARRNRKPSPSETKQSISFTSIHHSRQWYSLNPPVSRTTAGHSPMTGFSRLLPAVFHIVQPRSCAFVIPPRMMLNDIKDLMLFE